ncbi:MAG: tol-pal system YbgF family protein [Blastocatellales bacterium]
MQRYGYLVFATALFLVIGASLPNSNDKELIIRLQGEILVLQRQIRDLQESFDKWHVKSETSLDNLSSASETSTRTLSSIEDKLQRNQGSQTNAVAGVNAHLAKLSEQVSINNQQTAQMNQHINALRQSLQDYQQKLREKEASDFKPDTNDPEMVFAQAYLKYKNKEHEVAINLFRSYLNAFGQNEKADDASFWIAESFTAQGRFAEALSEYNNLLARYPGGDRTVSARLKKGVTLLRLERRQEGVEALKAVINLYPNSRESELARSELTRLGEI